MVTLGAVLVGVVWGWALMLSARRSPCGGRAAAAATLGTTIMASGLGAIFGGPAVPWFASGAAAGFLAHATWLEDLRRRSAWRQPEGGT